MEKIRSRGTTCFINSNINFGRRSVWGAKSTFCSTLKKTTNKLTNNNLESPLPVIRPSPNCEQVSHLCQVERMMWLFLYCQFAQCDQSCAHIHQYPGADHSWSHAWHLQYQDHVQPLMSQQGLVLGQFWSQAEQPHAPVVFCPYKNDTKLTYTSVFYADIHCRWSHANVQNGETQYLSGHSAFGE